MTTRTDPRKRILDRFMRRFEDPFLNLKLPSSSTRFSRFNTQDLDFGDDDPLVGGTRDLAESKVDPNFQTTGGVIARRESEVASQAERLLDSLGPNASEREREQLRAIIAQGGQLPNETSRGMLARSFFGALDWLDKPRKTVMAGLADAFNVGPEFSGNAAIAEIWSGRANTDPNLQVPQEFRNEEGQVTFQGSQLLRELGWGTKADEGVQGSAGNKVARGAAGFGVDMLLDPVNWLSFGTLGLGKAAASSALKAGMSDAMQTAARNLADGVVDDIADPLVRFMGERLDQAARQVVPKRVDDYMASLGRAATDAEREAAYRTFAREFFEQEGRNAARAGGTILDEGAVYEEALDAASALDSPFAGIWNDVSKLVAEKKWATLAERYPAIVSSKMMPTYATGGVTITTPFFRRQAGGINVGFRTDRAVSAPLRKTMNALSDKLEHVEVMQRMVSAWGRRSNQAIDFALAREGKAWAADQARGAQRWAKELLGVADAPSSLQASLRRLTQAAGDDNVDPQEAYTWLARQLDEGMSASVKEQLQVVPPRLQGVIDEIAEEVRTVHRTLHKAMRTFDPEVGEIENYLPSITTKEFDDFLDKNKDKLNIPLELFEEEGGYAHLGAVVLSEMLERLASARDGAESMARDIDSSRFFNRRHVGKTLLTPLGGVQVHALDKEYISKLLAKHGQDGVQVGYISKAEINKGVQAALEKLERVGRIPKAPKLDAFSLDLPKVLDSYTAAIERVVGYRQLLRTAEALQLVTARPKALEIGNTLARLGRRGGVQSKEQAKILRLARRYMQGDVAPEGLRQVRRVEIMSGWSVDLPELVADDPKVVKALADLRAGAERALGKGKEHAVALERTVLELVDGGVPRQMAEAAVIGSDTMLAEAVAAIRASANETVAELRAAAASMAAKGAARAVKDAAAGMDAVEAGAREQLAATRAAIGNLRREWAETFSWKSSTSDEIVDLLAEVDGRKPTAVLAELIDKKVTDDLMATVAPFVSESRLAEVRAALGRESADVRASLHKQRDALGRLYAEQAEDIELRSALDAWESVVFPHLETGNVTIAQVAERLGTKEAPNWTAALRMLEAASGFDAGLESAQPALRSIAEEFAQKRGQHFMTRRIRDVGDKGQIRADYEMMPTLDARPEVRESFMAVVSETHQMVRRLQEAGYRFLPGDARTAPAFVSMERKAKNFLERKFIYVSTEINPTEHELFSSARFGLEVDGVVLPFGNLFDSVHEIFGHFLAGRTKSSIRDLPEQITEAWLDHGQMYSAQARPAFATLTRGRRMSFATETVTVPVEPEELMRAAAAGLPPPKPKTFPKVVYPPRKIGLLHPSWSGLMLPDDWGAGFQGRLQSRWGGRLAQASGKLDLRRKDLAAARSLLVTKIHPVGEVWKARTADGTIREFATEAEALAFAESRMDDMRRVRDGLEEVRRWLDDQPLASFEGVPELDIAGARAPEVEKLDTISKMRLVREAERADRKAWARYQKDLKKWEAAQGERGFGELAEDENWTAREWWRGLSEDEKAEFPYLEGFDAGRRLGGSAASQKPVPPVLKVTKVADDGSLVVDAKQVKAAEDPAFWSEDVEQVLETGDRPNWQVETMGDRPEGFYMPTARAPMRGAPRGGRSADEVAAEAQLNQVRAELTRQWMNLSVPMEYTPGSGAVALSVEDLERKIGLLEQAINNLNAGLYAGEGQMRVLDALGGQMPVGLEQAGWGHPLFTDPDWRALWGADLLEADGRRRLLRQGAAELADSQGLAQLQVPPASIGSIPPTKKTDASWGTEGFRTGAARQRRGVAGAQAEVDQTTGLMAATTAALSALRMGDANLIAANESEVRRLLDLVGVDASRLRIDPLTDGGYSVRYVTGAETEVEHLIPPDGVRSALAEWVPFDAYGLPLDEVVRRSVDLVDQGVLSYGMLPEEVGQFLLRAKGGIPSETGQWEYLNRLAGDLAVRAARGDDTAQRAARNARRRKPYGEASQKLQELLKTVGLIVNRKVARGASSEALEGLWLDSKGVLERVLSPKDFARLANLVETAPLVKKMSAQSRNLAAEQVAKRWMPVSEAMGRFERAKMEAVQALSGPTADPRVTVEVLKVVDQLENQLSLLNVYGKYSEGVLEVEEGYRQATLDQMTRDSFSARFLAVNEAKSQWAGTLRGLAAREPGFIEFVEREAKGMLPEDGNVKAWLLRLASDLDESDELIEVPVQAGKRGMVNPRSAGIIGTELIDKDIDATFAVLVQSMASHVAAHYTPLGVKLLGTQLRAFERYWKTVVTVVRPTFVPRNIVGGIWNAMVANTGAREYRWVSANAIRLRNRMRRMGFEEALEFLPEADRQVWRDAKRWGIFDTQYTADIMNPITGGNSVTLRPWAGLTPATRDKAWVAAEVGGRFMQASEDFIRMAVFKRWHDGSATSGRRAAAVVFATQFDYSDLTRIEARIKQWIPFYVWTRRNIPLQVQTLLERPGIMNRYQNLQGNVEATFEDGDYTFADRQVKPSWMGGLAADLDTVIDHGDGLWTRLLFSPDLPAKDLEQMISKFSGKNPLTAAFGVGAEMMSPSLKAFAMAALGKDDVSQYAQKVNAPIGLAEVLRGLNEVGLWWGETQGGEPQITKTTREAWNMLFPYLPEWADVAGQSSNDPLRALDQGMRLDDGLTGAERARSALLGIGKAFGVRGATPHDSFTPILSADRLIENIEARAIGEGRLGLEGAQGAPRETPRGAGLAKEADYFTVDQLAAWTSEPVSPASVVLDGDTLILTLDDGTTERVRLLGVNTPEAGELGASDAKAFLQEALETWGGEVTLVKDVVDRDAFGRALRYVWIGDRMLNLELVRAGHAAPQPYYPNRRFETVFEGAEP